MMIIDSHVHIGSIGRFDMKPEYVIDSMERYGIDYSLVSSIAGASPPPKKFLMVFSQP